MVVVLSVVPQVLYALVALGAGLVADRWGIVAASLAIQAVALVALLLAWWVHAQSPRDGGATHRVRACPPCELPQVSTVRGRSRTARSLAFSA
ncbi:hypothetical protein [Nonomuraea glycinis]|uniref:hypothetical protein n=1 Tax=Nonomuraea glycinis TaxID=2047744 RepID=UPI0033BF6D2F